MGDAYARAASDFSHVIIVLGCLATIAVILRLLARWFSKRPWSADDGCIVVALLLMYGLVINAGFMYNFGGLGREFATLSESEIRLFFKTFYISQILYFLTITPIKFSIIFLYRRIFTTRPFLIATVVVGVIVVMWFIGGLVPTIFQCSPIEAAWNTDVQGRCIPLVPLFAGLTISNMLTDVILLCLPLRMIWCLNLAMKQRIVVTGLFLMGGLVCIISLVRVVTQYGEDWSDPSLAVLHCALWTILEPQIAIISACLPTLRPLVPARLFPTSFSLPYFNGKGSSYPSTTTGTGTGSRSAADSRARHSTVKKSWYGFTAGSDPQVQCTIAHEPSAADIPLKDFWERDNGSRERGMDSKEGGDRGGGGRLARGQGIHVREVVEVV